VTPVGATARAFPDEAGSLGMALCAFVEPVDLELKPVEAEVEEQVALEQSRRFVGEPPAAEIGMYRKIREVRDPRAAVRDLEAQRAGGMPVSLPLDLDQEAAELIGLVLRALDLRKQPFTVTRPNDGEVRLHVLVGRQFENEVDVARVRPAEPQAFALDDAQGDGVAGAGARRGSRTAPEPSATPPRISTIPANSSTVSGSPSSVTP